MVTSSLLKPEFISSIGNIQLIARAVVEGFISGLHRSPYKGFSAEFAEFREYVPGDELRYLDWKVYGKSDRLVVKEFHEETNLRSYILVDCSSSMGYGSGEISKFRYAQLLAASFAYFLIRQQDSVGIVTFDSDIRRFLKPASGPMHLQNVLSVIEGSGAEGSTGLADVFHKLAEGIRKRGLIIVLSDLYGDPEALRSALNHFLHRKHELIVFHVLDPVELTLDFPGPVDLLDMETGERLELDATVVREEYRRTLQKFINGFREMAREGSFDYVTADTSRPFHEMLTAYLRKRERLG